MKLEDFIPGTEHTLTGFILISPYGNLTHAGCPMEDNGYVTVVPHDIQFTIPEGFNAIQEAVKALDAEMEKERGELAEKLRSLQAKKNDLLQLSYGGNDILDAENPNVPNP